MHSGYLPTLAEWSYSFIHGLYYICFDKGQQKKSQSKTLYSCVRFVLLRVCLRKCVCAFVWSEVLFVWMNTVSFVFVHHKSLLPLFPNVHCAKWINNIPAFYTYLCFSRRHSQLCIFISLIRIYWAPQNISVFNLSSPNSRRISSTTQRDLFFFISRRCRAVCECNFLMPNNYM